MRHKGALQLVLMCADRRRAQRDKREDRLHAGGFRKNGAVEAWQSNAPVAPNTHKFGSDEISLLIDP